MLDQTLSVGRSGRPPWLGKVRPSRDKELGQDAGGNREPWGRAELDFTANIYWAQGYGGHCHRLSGDRDRQRHEPCIMPVHLSPSSSICGDMGIKEQAL